MALLALAAWETGGAWGSLWLLVPLATAVSLLVAWRFGAWALPIPVLALGLAVTLFPGNVLWMGWLPAAALAGVWMGLREEGGGLTLGERAWTLLPVLAVAAMLPWAPGYAATLARVSAHMREADAQMTEFYRQLGMSGDRLRGWESALRESAGLRETVLPYALPTVLFVWVALLVQSGRTLASRVGTLLRWPRLTIGHLIEWRLPDGALWVFLLGLALIVSKLTPWAPTAWTLAVNGALGYCLQGIGVVQSLLLVRGFPPYMVTILLVFALVMAWPVFLLLAACVGLSDIWLDYRRLERVPHEE